MQRTILGRMRLGSSVSMKRNLGCGRKLFQVHLSCPMYRPVHQKEEKPLLVKIQTTESCQVGKLRERNHFHSKCGKTGQFSELLKHGLSCLVCHHVKGHSWCLRKSKVATYRRWHPGHALCFWGRSMREGLREAQSHDSHLPTSGFNMASWEATVQDKRTKPENLSSIPVLPLLAEWPLLNHLTFSSLYFCTLSWIFLIQLVLRNQRRIACGVLWTSQSSGVAETRQY